MRSKALFFSVVLAFLCGCSSPRPGGGLEKYNCIETTEKYCIIAHGQNLIKLHANREFALCNGTPLQLPVPPIYNPQTKLFTVKPEILTQIIDPLLKGALLHKAVKLIVIDAGHGGHDTGALGGNSKEKDLNLALAVELQQSLKTRGFKVQLTRQDDRFLALTDRVKITEKLGGDLFISLHCNSAKNNPKAAGIECFASKKPLPESTVLAMYIQQQLIRSTGFANRGVKFADFVVVKQKIPAVLIEMGFISNSGEEKRLNTSRYRQTAAEAIASAIRNFAVPIPPVNDTSDVQKSGNPPNPNAKPAVQKKNRRSGKAEIRGKSSSPLPPSRGQSADKPAARRSSQGAAKQEHP